MRDGPHRSLLRRVHDQELDLAAEAAGAVRGLGAVADGVAAAEPVDLYLHLHLHIAAHHVEELDAGVRVRLREVWRRAGDLDGLDLPAVVHERPDLAVRWVPEIGRAHACTPATIAYTVSRILFEN